MSWLYKHGYPGLVAPMFFSLFTVLSALALVQSEPFNLDDLKPKPVEGWISGLISYGNTVYLTAFSDRESYVQNVTSGDAEVVANLPDNNPNKSVWLTSPTTGYAVNHEDGFRLSSNQSSIDFDSEEVFNKYPIIGVYAVDKQVYISTLEAIHTGYLSTIWQLKDDKFNEWFKVEGHFSNFVLSKDLKYIYGINYNDKLIKAKILTKCRSGTKAEIIKPGSSDYHLDYIWGIAITETNTLFVTTGENFIQKFDEDLNPGEKFQIQVYATKIAYANGYLYLGGGCTNDLSRDCLQKVAINQGHN